VHIVLSSLIVEIDRQLLFDRESIACARVV
jgi:hypothetical protein